MLTILLATDDSSRRPTRHLCSLPPPLRLKILNIMGHFWLVRGNWHTEGLNFATILFSFLPFTFSSFRTPPQLSFCSFSWLNVNPSMYSPVHPSLAASVVQFPVPGTFCSHPETNLDRIGKWVCWLQRTTLPLRSTQSVFLSVFACWSHAALEILKSEVHLCNPKWERFEFHFSVHFQIRYIYLSWQLHATHVFWSVRL